MSFIKIATLIGNTIFLVLLFLALIVDGEFADSEIIYAVGGMLLLVSNIYFVYSHSRGNDWLTLRLKRKAMEEQKKIQELRDDSH